MTLADLGLLSEEVDRQTERDIDAYQAEDLAQLLALVALGSATTVLARSTAERYPRPGVSYIPISDAPPARLAIVWQEHASSLGIAALVRATTALRESAGGLVDHGGA